MWDVLRTSLFFSGQLLRVMISRHEKKVLFVRTAYDKIDLNVLSGLLCHSYNEFFGCIVKLYNVHCIAMPEGAK